MSSNTSKIFPSNYGSYTSCRKVKQNMLTLPLCLLLLQTCCIFSLRINLFAKLPLSGPSSFGAVKSIKSAMGKSTAVASFPEACIQHDFCDWDNLVFSMICFGTCSTELASVFCIRLMLIALCGVSNREYPKIPRCISVKILTLMLCGTVRKGH